MIRGIQALDLLTPPVAEKLVKNQEQINQLHEVLSTVRLDKQNALNRRLVRKTQDGTLGQPEKGDETVSEEDDGTVSFGDTTYNISGPEPTVKPASSMLPYLLAAALGGTGLGAAAVALPASWKVLNPPPVTQPSDADTQYDLTFKD